MKNTEDEQINYYNEFCRLYLANHILATQLKELNLEKSELIVKLGKLEVKSTLFRKKQNSFRKATAVRSIKKSAESVDPQST